jgi:fido (protein-threonine AMPylation protein)
MSNDPLVEEKDGSTPLSEEELEGLIPSYITLRSELNEAEQANILEAEEWAFNRKRDVLSEKFLNIMHKRMLGRVWKWAGQHRRTGKNVGVDAYRIPVELRQLLDDVRFWIEKETYLPDKIRRKISPQACLDTYVSQWQWPPCPTGHGLASHRPWSGSLYMGQEKSGRCK